MIPVKSSNIKAIGYNKDNKTLSVEFKVGGTYHYEQVPEALFTNMSKSESVGKFFAQHVKGAGFKFTKEMPKTQE